MNDSNRPASSVASPTYQTYQASTYLFGGNAPYVEEMYEIYLANPGSVPDSWRQAQLRVSSTSTSHSVRERLAPGSTT